MNLQKISKYIEYFSKKRTLRNMGFLLFGEIISKILMFVITIYLARKLAPEFYGQYSLAYNFVLGFIFLINLGMNTIVLRDGSRKLESLNESISKVFSFRILLGILVGIGISLITYLFLPYNNSLKFLIYIATIMLLLKSIIDLLNMVFRAAERMNYNSLIRVLEIVIFSIVIWLLFINNANPLSVIIAWILSHIIIIILQFILIKKFIKFKFNLKIDFMYCFNILKYSFWIGLAAFIASFYGKINIFIISLYLSISSVAFYNIALQLVTAGTLLRGVISDAIFPNTCKRIYDKDYPKKLLKYISILTVLSAFGALLITILAKYIVLIAFGEEYLPAVPVLQILIWYVPIFIYNIWGLQILDSTGNQKYHVVNELVILTFTILINLALIQKYGIVGAAISSVMARFLGSIYLNYQANKIINKIQKGAV